MTLQYVPVTTTMKFESNSPMLPALIYWNGELGVGYSRLYEASNTHRNYQLPNLYLCRMEEVPDPPSAMLEVTHDDALDRIAAALESIAIALRGSIR